MLAIKRSYEIQPLVISQPKMIPAKRLLHCPETILCHQPGFCHFTSMCNNKFNIGFSGKLKVKVYVLLAANKGLITIF